MQIRLIASALMQIALYGVLSFYGIGNWYLIVGLVSNTILLMRIFIGFGLKYTLSRFFRGEVFPLYLYLLWLAIYPQQQHLFNIPIILSCIGKTYLLFSTAQDLWIDAVENLINLQSQTELFIALYHLLKISVMKKEQMAYAMVQYALLIAIFKLKFQIHYGTRKLYESMHFALDRCAKGLKIRPFYHLIQRIFSNLAGDWRHSKIVSY